MSKLPSQIIPAAMQDYPVILNMGKFYEYEMSKYCGWAWQGENGGYPSAFLVNNFRTYFEDSTRKPFLIKVNNELAGFILLNQAGLNPKTEWNMGEFFILGKFQGQGIGLQVAHQIWHMHPGIWEVAVLPDNKPAIAFWKKAIESYTAGQYQLEHKTVDYDKEQPIRHIFSFTAPMQN